MAKDWNILVADDEPTFLDSTADIFKDQGYACERVENGIDAIEALSKTRFDFLVADINMPGNLKMEFIQQAYQIRPEMPIIIVTGYPSLSTAVQSLRLSKWLRWSTMSARCLNRWLASERLRSERS